jgi:hypothetical protein
MDTCPKLTWTARSEKGRQDQCSDDRMRNGNILQEKWCIEPGFWMDTEGVSNVAKPDGNLQQLLGTFQSLSL